MSKYIMKEYFFEEPNATNLAIMRIEARRRRRITYDCMNAIVKGDKVECKKGHALGYLAKKQFDLLYALKGKTGGHCNKCKDYDEEKGE